MSGTRGGEKKRWACAEEEGGVVRIEEDGRKGR